MAKLIPIRPSRVLAEKPTVARCAEDYKAGETVREIAEEQWKPVRPRLWGRK